MKLMYTGPKKERTVEYPLPLLSKGMKEGEVKFVKGQVTDCPDMVAEKLLALAPEYFKTVATPAIQKGL
jgi:hypothetical protein